MKITRALELCFAKAGGRAPVTGNVRLYVMRRALIAFIAAALIVGATTAAFLMLDDALGPGFAFWPGFIVQGGLERAGISTTNRILPLATLLFWWIAIWLALSLLARRRPRAA